MLSWLVFYIEAFDCYCFWAGVTCWRFLWFLDNYIFHFDTNLTLIILSLNFIDGWSILYTWWLALLNDWHQTFLQIATYQSKIRQLYQSWNKNIWCLVAVQIQKLGVEAYKENLTTKKFRSMRSDWINLIITVCL